MSDFGATDNPRKPETVKIKPASGKPRGKIEGLDQLQCIDTLTDLLSNTNSYYRYYLFLPQETFRKQQMKEGRSPKALRLVLDTEKNTHVYDAVLWSLAALLLCGMVWIIVRWAL